MTTPAATSPDNKTAAEFSNVTLRRGEVLALDDVSLSLPLGQTTAVPHMRNGNRNT